MRGNAVHFTQTKTDKNRSAPIDPALAEEILAFRASKSEVIGDHIFENSAGAFRMGVRDACIELPEGQLIHVLRHTFASHFMMNGGNILTLQRILGHSSLQMTMRYSHLAPDHLKEATRLPPLSRYRIGRAPGLRFRPGIKTLTALKLATSLNWKHPIRSTNIANTRLFALT
ncbi:tyrosine-type recombinase/integrase [Burkholderia pseudomallei]|nr:hypothetical protein CNX72_17280 [Burkholderia pseudomallei]AYX29628.1 hypothetical protein EGY16_17305 [Burkholderia pseudomallei]MBF3779896.1 tyrosine-type recombinase/integrase [Burkholderia pseudomallei]MBF4060396.1 tyrosine-type recombinase/integrase [Burkholderia pseudomallei]MBF4078463.1 tyrosine-type recombinase/integrase [Burkholderia pseudomallei]